MNTSYRHIHDSFARQTFMRTLGAEIISVGAGSCVLSAPLAAHLLQQHGAGHAAVSFALGDVAAGYAALTTMAAGAEVMTAEIKINLLRPALGEALEATGTVLRAGRRLVVVRADVHALQDGQRLLIAALQGTMVPVAP